MAVERTGNEGTVDAGTFHRSAVPRPGYSALDPCVHCGFCLPACPDLPGHRRRGHSPRGRIVLMRALERGEIEPQRPRAAANTSTHVSAAAAASRSAPPAWATVAGWRRRGSSSSTAAASPRWPGWCWACSDTEALWRPLFAWPGRSGHRSAAPAGREGTVRVRDGHAGVIGRDAEQAEQTDSRLRTALAVTGLLRPSRRPARPSPCSAAAS